MNEYTRVLSPQTRQRYWLAWLLMLSGLAVIFSSIYFLYFPVGFQGGKNPYYNTVVVFDRQSWDLIHAWSGIAMIVVLLVHIPVHWNWIKTMFQRCLPGSVCKIGKLNKRARLNIILDVVAALSFVFAAASGMYLLFLPNGKQALTTSTILFGYRTWDTIHTWSGVVMIIASLLHFLIHWRWVTKVSRKVFKTQKALSIEKA